MRKQFHPIGAQEPQNPDGQLASDREPNLQPATNGAQPNGAAQAQIRLNRSATVPATASGAPGTAVLIIQPSWASNSANAIVAARLAAVTPFNIEGRYVVKPAFLTVLRAVEGVDQAQIVFPYREVKKLLFQASVRERVSVCIF